MSARQLSRPPGPRSPRTLRDAAEVVIREIRTRRSEDRNPYLVAIDGPSGSGKTSIAETVAGPMEAAVIHSDDFFTAGLSDEDWDIRSALARARDCIDWRRLRVEAIEPLLAGRTAEWHPFDWDTGPRADGSFGLSTKTVRVAPRPTILLEGAYASRPELADVVDLSVLVVAPPDSRRERLAMRDGAEFFTEWHDRWGVAEAYYFTEIRPRSAFQLVVDT